MYLTPIPQSLISSPYYNPSVRYSNSSALTSDRDPSKSNYTFYNHLLATRAPGFRLTSSNSSNIGRVTIYWASVFWRRTTYASTSSSNAAKTASTNGGYSHPPTTLCRSFTIPSDGMNQIPIFLCGMNNQSLIIQVEKYQDQVVYMVKTNWF